MKVFALGTLLFTAAVLAAPLPVTAQSAMVLKSPATTQYGNHRALPSCATIAVQDGDPATGPAVISMKTSGRCTVPWHWHTGNERLVIVRGSAKLEMKGMPTATAHAGDFILMPAKSMHQFTAEGPSEQYVITDAPFDIHYVDKAGTEITPEQALKTSVQ